ncbi:MAG: hypothetical protein CBC48_18055 [bacterium TMED88]|nr:MAG: hypothetical protein CBC48_18055 [bacterium TMED88]
MNILLRILLFSVILPIVFCKPCMEARLEVQQNNHIGVFIPRCDEVNADLYKPLQCHGSTGYCWCVHYETGEQKGEQFLLWELDPKIDLLTYC